MTARLDVTPKTTEQNRTVRTGKSEVKETSNKTCARGIVLLKLTTDRYEASRDLYVTAELLAICCFQASGQNDAQNIRIKQMTEKQADHQMDPV